MRKVFISLVLISIVSFAFAQDQYLNRDIKPNMSMKKTQVYTLDIFNGLSFPQGDLNNFLKDGFNSGILIHKRFGKTLSIGLSANHSRFSHKLSLGPVQTSKHQELSATSFDIGPQYNLNIGRFALEFYGRSGLSIVNSPQSSMMYPETDITITTLEAYNSTALTTRLGANMTATISERVNLYLSSEFITNLNKDLNYQTRDLSKVFREDGSIDADAANQLPYTNESLSLSMLNVNFGVRISIGGRGNKRKSNPTLREYGMSGSNLMYEVQNSQDNKGENQAVNRAQNSNSSRSNNFSSSVPESNRGGRDTFATSHNLRRSNNSSVIAPDPDENESRLDFQTEVEVSLVDIPQEKLRFKTKRQLAKQRRQQKRIERRLKRLKTTGEISNED